MTQLTISQAAEAVLLKWKTEWEAIHPTIPYCHGDEHFEEPEPWTGDPAIVPSYWCRMAFQMLPGVQFTLGERGNRIYRRQAMIWVQIFGPENNGVDKNSAGHLSLIDDINEFFEGEAFSGIDPNGAANPTEVGGDGKWYQWSVTYPVTFYAVK